MNTEDEIQVAGMSIQLVQACHGEWRAFGPDGFIAAGDTRDEVVETASRVAIRSLIGWYAKSRSNNTIE